MRCPAPERKLAASGAGRDSTSFARTSFSDSAGAVRKERWRMSIVWSTKNVCCSQFIVDVLNGGAYPKRTVPRSGSGACGRIPASASASNASCTAK